MNHQQRQLWDRIRNFAFDDPDTAASFVQKLARQNAWPIDYAARVIEEYRRFAFLAAAAGHPVSPSDAVDQVWHLHLTYTRSYWEQFCPHVLGTPLHHQPSRGSKAEQQMYNDWYARTLQSYRRLFDREAPEDIWPDPAIHAADHADYLRIRRDRFWLISKPRLRRLINAGALLMSLPLMVAGCAPLFEQFMDPLDMQGPEFLDFFFGSAVLFLAYAGFMRYLLRRPGGSVDADALRLDPYQAALLAGGGRRAWQIAVTRLARRHVLQFDGHGKAQINRPLPDDSSSIEQAVYAYAGSQPWRATLAQAQAALRSTLTRRGLLVSSDQALLVRVIPCLIAMLIPAYGMVKLVIGLTRGRPVGYLFLLCLVFGAIALLLLRHPHRSRRGDRVLRMLRNRHDGPAASGRSSASEAGMDVPMAASLLGIGLVTHLPHPAPEPVFWQRGGSGASGGGCAAACGAASACGGGGCGGCGGCGGS